MPRVRVFVAALLLVAAPATLYAMDRATVVAALERLVRTGEPRHVSHDEGEELWTALQPMLRDTSDTELQSLARRAACPIVPEMFRPMTTVGQPLSVEIRGARVLPLPQLPRYVALVEASVDGQPWVKAFELPACTGAGAALESFLPPAALVPGFHVLNLRARISYAKAQDRDEVRDLPPVPYGIVPAASPLLTQARTVPVSVLDADLAATPLSRWLAAFTTVHMETMAWCNRHAGRGLETEPSDAVCLLTTFGAESSPRLGEVWIELGRLGIGPDGVRWTASAPSLVDAAVIDRGDTAGGRSQVPLSALPSLLSASGPPVPRPVIVVTPADMTAEPAVPSPGQPASIHVSVWNNGDAPANGVTIDVMAGSSTEGPVLHRRFVRAIPPRDRVQLDLNTTFTHAYGWIMVMALQLTEDSEFGWTGTDGADEPLAIAFVNRPALPPALVATICRNAVGHYRCGS